MRYFNLISFLIITTFLSTSCNGPGGSGKQPDWVVEKIDTALTNDSSSPGSRSMVHVILRSLIDGSADTLELSASEANKMKAGDTLYNRY